MSVPKRELTVDGFELQLATNYLGHFLLFHLLKDVMIQSSTPEFNSRLVQVSSASHHFSEIQFDDLNCETAYDPKNAYGQSKLAQIYLANYVDRHFGAQGLHGLSLMPGGIRTNILRHVPSSVVDKMMAASDFLPKWYKSPEQGAATTLVAAIGQEYEGRGGLYLEDCDVAKTEPLIPMIKGVKEYAFDEEKQDRLYKKTLELLKLAA
ncbi:hypothetical protein F5Y19DRAFT_447564 [Xylariaceae sp. FL1651]|nr:hypothetical protein F5Y19DRAFT_447564 [Xylariaceae sp. FL1651]